VPAVVCRAVTERPDGVELGAARLATPEVEARVIDAMSWATAVPAATRTQWRAAAVYGDGRAAERGAAFIAARLRAPAS
jgi:UDP-N-acetylglucosamine 2-epimerase (non-hydrolysing)